MNKISIKKQYGFSILSLIVGIAVIGFVAIFGFKIGYAYMEKATVESVIDAAFSDINKDDDKDPKKIKSNISKKLQVHTTNIKDSDITVRRDGSNVEVSVDLNRNIGITDEISIDIDLSFEKDLNSSK